MDKKNIIGWKMINGGKAEPVYDDFEVPSEEEQEKLINAISEDIKKEIDKELGEFMLRPLRNVAMWDTQRVLDYKAKIETLISDLKRYGTANKESREKLLEKTKNYNKELQKILAKRENI